MDDIHTIAMAHEMAEAALNPSALEDGSGCWTGRGYEFIDICDNQRGYIYMNAVEPYGYSRMFAMPSMVTITRYAVTPILV